MINNNQIQDGKQLENLYIALFLLAEQHRKLKHEPQAHEIHSYSIPHSGTSNNLGIFACYAR